MDDINYDDDDFDQDTDNLGDEALDKLGALVSGRWEDDQDTSDYIRSIREELDQGSDDSLAGGIDLDMDAEISNLLGESMEHIQMKAKTREGSASLRDDFLDEISPLFGEERKDEFRLSSRTLDKFDIPLGLESPDLDRTLSPAKSLGLAGLGVLTEDSGGLALMNEAHQKSLPSLDKDTRQSRLLDRTSPDISGLLGGDDMDSSRLSQETKRSSRSHRRNSKDQSGVSSGDGLSDNPGLMNGHDHLLSGSSALWESSNHKRRMSDVERERLASESAKAQAEIENALNSRLSEKTPSPLAKTHSSGKYSSSPADIAEMTAAVERRWAFKPILGDLELGKIKRSPAGSLGDSIDSQREESGHQLKRMLQDIQEVTGDLADLQHRKEILQRELLLLQETLGRNKSELKRCEKKAGEHRSASKELQAEVGSMQRKREYLQGELRKLDSALAERRSVREGSPLSPTQSKNSEDYMKLLNDNTQLKSDLEAVRSKLKADGLAKEKEISQLKRQLKAASEDLFAEKKKARDQYDKLKEDYEEAQRQLRDTLRDKMSAVSRARDDAETSKHVDLEVMKVKILREKDSELEKIKEKLGRQVEDMKKSLLAKDKELLKANLKWKERNEAGSALSAQLSECKKQLAEKDSLLSKSDRKTRTQLDDVNRTLTARESEIKQLKSLLKQQEESERSLGERLRAEAHKQMRKAVEHERSQQGKTREQELKRERELMKDEMERSVAAAKDELAKEHQKSKQMQETMNSLRQEVEEQRQLAKQANREKLAAVNKVKEIARLSRRQDFEKLKEKLQQNHHSSIKKLRSKVLKLDEDIKQAKENEKVLQQRERDLVAKIELSEKAIVMEINEECRKTSAAVSSFSVGYGRRSRPGTPKLFGSMERLPTGGPERERPMSAPPMPVRKDSNSSKAALSQLRSSNDELRSHLSQLKSELDRERQTATQLHRDKVAELKKVRDSVQTERADEIQGLKQKLLKELASEKASFQKQALKEVTLKFHKQLKAKDDELRELGQEIQKLRDEGSQKMTHLVHSGMNQEADRRAKEHIRKLEIQQRAERAAFQREKEKLERELKRLGQEAATHAAAAAAASSTASSTASTTVVDKTTASASAEAAKAKAAVGLVHRLQTKMKQLYGENERLKREVAELQKVSVAARQTPDTPQPRDNSIEAQDSGLSSMAADAGFADAHHLQQELKASVRKNQRMSALLNEKMKEVVKLQNQLKHLNKEFLVLQREHSVTVDRLGDDIDNNVS